MKKAESLKDRMLENLEQVIDPELSCDIVNLGLIYGLTFADGTATVTMTLTTMGCPLMAVLEEMVKNALLPIPEIDEVVVKLVWEPAWNIDRMSRYARIALGIHR